MVWPPSCAAVVPTQLEEGVVEGEAIGHEIEFPLAEPGHAHREPELDLGIVERFLALAARG